MGLGQSKPPWLCAAPCCQDAEGSSVESVIVESGPELSSVPQLTRGLMGDIIGCRSMTPSKSLAFTSQMSRAQTESFTKSLTRALTKKLTVGGFNGSLANAAALDIRSEATMDNEATTDSVLDVDNESEADMDEDAAWVIDCLESAQEKMPGVVISQETLDWCTATNVRIYYDGRDGDADKAGTILAETIKWREKNADILYGKRTPAFNLGDMRVVAVGESGTPIIYFCFVHQKSPNVTDKIEHMAGVLEAAVNCMGDGVTQFDIVVDCPGFSVTSNLDPRPTVALMTMLKQPYRDRLRAGFLVDAPSAIGPVWRVASGALPPATVEKVSFVSAAEIVQKMQEAHGDAAANRLQALVKGNRSAATMKPRKIPLDLDD